MTSPCDIPDEKGKSDSSDSPCPQDPAKCYICEHRDTYCKDEKMRKKMRKQIKNEDNWGLNKTCKCQTFVHSQCHAKWSKWFGAACPKCLSTGDGPSPGDEFVRCAPIVLALVALSVVLGGFMVGCVIDSMDQFREIGQLTNEIRMLESQIIVHRPPPVGEPLRNGDATETDGHRLEEPLIPTKDNLVAIMHAVSDNDDYDLKRIGEEMHKAVWKLDCDVEVHVASTKQECRRLAAFLFSDSDSYKVDCARGGIMKISWCD